MLKAGSALAGGVATMGETCGALTGAIMAIGCVVGRERLEDVGQYQKAKEPAKLMYQRFRERVGHTICADIHRIKYGRVYRLCDPAEARAFHEQGGHARTGCPEVCGIAARTCAEILLDLRASPSAPPG